MPRPDVVASIDMGSGRITGIIAERDPGNQAIKVLSGAQVECVGLKEGAVTDISATAAGVQRVMEEAETKANVTVGEVYMGIRGRHIETFSNRGAYNIARTDKEITADDVANVIENAKAIPISNDREILEIVPQCYALDRVRGVPNPIGMEGSLLEVAVHIATVSSTHLSNLSRAVGKGGFRTVDIMYGLFALGQAIVTPEEKELGCLLLDIGGHNVSMAIYLEGHIRYTKNISLGSDLITRDLACGLKTSRVNAMGIKEKYGVALPSFLELDETITVPGLDNTLHQYKISELLPYIQPRVEEILDEVNREIKNSNYPDLPGGCILTGGGSLLKGMPEAVSQVLGIEQVRMGLVPKEFVIADEEYLTPAYTTAISILLYPVLRTWAEGDMMPRKRSPLVRRFKSWLQEMF